MNQWLWCWKQTRFDIDNNYTKKLITVDCKWFHCKLHCLGLLFAKSIVG